MEFHIGALIRNKKPYFGEAVKLIVDKDEKQVYVIDGPNRNGFFDYPKHREIMFKDQMKYYRKARLFEVLFLTIYGWVNRWQYLARHKSAL